MKKYSPLQAIRKHCVDHCCAGQSQEVSLCPVDDCPLFIFRSGRKAAEENTSPDISYCGSSGKVSVQKSELTALKGIKFKCMDCSGGYFAEVRECSNRDCFLYPFRQGHNPARKGIGNRVGNGKEHQKTPTHEATGDGTHSGHSSGHGEEAELIGTISESGEI